LHSAIRDVIDEFYEDVATLLSAPADIEETSMIQDLPAAIREGTRRSLPSNS
jgi:hypothetical protein